MATPRRPSFHFFLLAAVLALLATVIGAVYTPPTGVKLELVHRHSPHPTPQASRLRRIARSDEIRLSGISEKVRLSNAGRRRVQENNSTNFSAWANTTTTRNASAELGMNSAADEGVGQYLVKLKVGSPPTTVTLIADTGSDLTWMSCRQKCRRGGCRKDLMGRPPYRADRSPTFKTIPCSSTTCTDGLSTLFSLSRCVSPSDPCAYDYRYSDGSNAQGVFGYDSVTFDLTAGKSRILPNVLIGCSEAYSGSNFAAASGVIGLGYSNYSLALNAANNFGGKFSYCLVDHLSSSNKSSYLVFGSHQNVSISFRRMRHTELLLGVLQPFYFVNIKGISIGGSMLNISAATWDVKGVGGTIVDSGSSLTGLTRPAYGPVMAALRRALLGFNNLDLDLGPVEFCFNSSGYTESMIPRLAIHFADGARFVPPVNSYVIDAAPGVKCLGFLPLPWPGTSVIGNILQQRHFWEFDLANARLGFATSSCT